MLDPKANKKSPNIELINGLRQADVANEFRKNIRHKAFIMVANFPFMITGKIIRIEADRVQILVEKAHTSKIEGRIITINFASIQVFYIEKCGLPRIPQNKKLILKGI